MEDNTIKAVTAMGCITTLMGYALSLGINGTVLATVVAILGGIGGYSIKAYIDSR